MSRDTQSLMISRTEWGDIIEVVNEAISHSLLKGSPEPALALGYEIKRSSMIRGVMLAHLLYELDETWDVFETDDDCSTAVDKAGIVAEETFKKYVAVYRWILVEHPELAGLPIEGLIKITAAARDGDLTDEDYKELALAPNVGAIIRVRDRVRDIQTSGHGAIRIWDDKDGYVYCRKGEGDIFNLTFLPFDSDNPVIAAAAARLRSVYVR